MKLPPNPLDVPPLPSQELLRGGFPRWASWVVSGAVSALLAAAFVFLVTR